MTVFNEDVVAGVTGHMNDDHPDDNLLIARAFGYPDATAGVMIGVTETHGAWTVTDPSGEHRLEVAWPGAPISERKETRREVVALYRAACEKLGVPARDEHAKPFSVMIREGSKSDHSDSEGASFMERIIKGQGSLQDYIDLVAQHYFMYEALEEAVSAVADDPAFAGFHPDALVRLPALEADLRSLIGDDWRERIEVLPATADYAARMREVAADGWVPGVVAHHYTRYLGDLSGGQIIAKVVAKQHGLDHDGVAFYDFADLGSPSAFKKAYRRRLDALGASLGEDERSRMLDEVHRAYRFNTEVFQDLAAAKAAA